MTALDDPERLAELERLDLIEAKPDAGFKRYTDLAAEMLDAPVALVSLVDSQRQAFLSKHVPDGPLKHVDETPLSYSFCQHAVRAKAPLIIPDAREDPLVRDNRATDDIYPTYYRANNARVLRNLGESVNVRPESTRFLTQPHPYSRCFAPAAFFELLLMRATMTRPLGRFGATIVMVFRKRPTESPVTVFRKQPTESPRIASAS